MKSSIINLLQAYKDPSIDAASIRIFPNSVVHEEESEDSEDIDALMDRMLEK